MKRLLVLTLLLSACTLPVPPKEPIPGNAHASSARRSEASKSSIPLPIVERERPSSSQSKTTTGSLVERAADGGILEIGLAEAPALIIFTNYSCEYCSQFMMQDFPRLLREYVDPGLLKVQIVPVTLKKYPTSANEAAALTCATAKAKGQQMHGKMLAATKRDRAGLLQQALSLKISNKDFGVCLDSTATIDQLATQQALIEHNGITFVPSFLFNGEKRVGYPSYADLRGWLEESLRQAM